jgi:CBS-domain-containing membrane protein
MTLDQVSAAFVAMSLALLGGGAGLHPPAAAVAEGGGLA